jgi:hypothetical protein
MLLIAASIAAALPQDRPPPTPAIVQARASMRIVSGARIQWDQKAGSGEIPAARTTVVQTAEGPRPASLIEFE